MITDRTKRRRVYRTLLLCCFLTALPVYLRAEDEQAPHNEVVAEINGQKITKSEFEQRFRSYITPYQQQLETARQGDSEAIIKSHKIIYLENMVNTRLLADEAVKLGLDKDKQVLALLNYYRIELLAKHLIERESENVSPVSDQQINEHYHNHSHEYRTPEKVELEHILLRVQPEMTETARSELLQQAKEIVQELQKGQDFATMAKQYSEAPDAEKGGYVGYVSKGQLYREIEDTAFSLPVGEVSAIIETPLGFHIIHVLDRKDGTLKKLEEVKEHIRNSIATRRKIEYIEAYIKELRDKADIAIYKKRLLE